jgi:hypothetical protein
VTYKPLTDEELENASGHERLLEQCRRANRLIPWIAVLRNSAEGEGDDRLIVSKVFFETLERKAMSYLGADHDR